MKQKLKWLFLFIPLSVGLFWLHPVRNAAFELFIDALLEESVTQVTPKQVDPSVVLLLDTREKVEYEISHLPGAVWVGFEDFDPSRIPGASPDQPMVTYCSVGYRSEKIGEKLMQMGYQNVRNLRGGAFRWLNEGRNLECGDSNTTNIHPYSNFWGIWLTAGNKTTEL